MTVAAFLALGIMSFLLVISRQFRPWMAFALVTGDAAILGASLYFALVGMGMGGNWVVAMPTIWAAPSFSRWARFDIGLLSRYGPH